MFRSRILSEAEWIVECDGEAVATLVEPRFTEMFWTSYQLEPLTTDLAKREALFTDEFWEQIWFCKEHAIRFRGRLSGKLASIALPSGAAGKMLRETGRINMRSMYIIRDPTKMERALQVLWRIFCPSYPVLLTATFMGVLIAGLLVDLQRPVPRSEEIGLSLLSGLIALVAIGLLRLALRITIYPVMVRRGGRSYFRRHFIRRH